MVPWIVDLDDLRVLIPGIIEELRGRGTAVASMEAGDLDRWRRAARWAGRALGWHVRTGVSDGRAWVTSDDWEAPARSEQIAADLLRCRIWISPARTRCLDQTFSESRQLTRRSSRASA